MGTGYFALLLVGITTVMSWSWKIARYTRCKVEKRRTFGDRLRKACLRLQTSGFREGGDDAKSE